MFDICLNLQLLFVTDNGIVLEGMPGLLKTDMRWPPKCYKGIFFFSKKNVPITGCHYNLNDLNMFLAIKLA